jgi:hypothetical protein
MPWGKTEDEKAARYEQHAVEQAAAQQRKEQEQYWASAVGKADAARRNGDAFFQVEIEISTLAGSASTLGSVPGGRMAEVHVAGVRFAGSSSGCDVKCDNQQGRTDVVVEDEPRVAGREVVSGKHFADVADCRAKIKDRERQ